jgi:hypothetical protein
MTSPNLLRAYRKPGKGNSIKAFPEGMLAVGIKPGTSKGFKAKDQKGESSLPSQSMGAATTICFRIS